MTLEQFAWAAGVAVAVIGFMETRIRYAISQSEKAQDDKHAATASVLTKLESTVASLNGHVVDFGNLVYELKGRLSSTKEVA